MDKQPQHQHQPIAIKNENNQQKIDQQRQQTQQRQEHTIDEQTQYKQEFMVDKQINERQQEDMIRIDEIIFSLDKMIKCILESKSQISNLRPLNKQQIVALLNSYKQLQYFIRQHSKKQPKSFLLLEYLPKQFLPAVLSYQQYIYQNTQTINQNQLYLNNISNQNNNSNSNNNPIKDYENQQDQLRSTNPLRSTTYNPLRQTTYNPLRQISHIKFNNLKQLYISNQHITNIQSLTFMYIPNITNIDLSDNHINTIDILAKGQLPNLQQINLSNNFISRIFNFQRFHNNKLVYLFDKKQQLKQFLIEDFTFIFKLQTSPKSIYQIFTQYQCQSQDYYYQMFRIKQPAIRQLLSFNKLFK